MANPRVLVLRTAGVNCEQETAYAWTLAGAVPEIMHVNCLRAAPERLHDYQVLTIPGGFSYGDDIAAGRIFANQLQLFLGDVLREYAGRERLILGICNGFQVLCKAGLLPGASDLPRVTMARNLSGKYEDRWVPLRRTAAACVFLAGQGEFELPVAHGEGRVLAEDPAAMQRLDDAGCVALRYGSGGGGPVGYPQNPNGSMLDVAGLCDRSGRILGLMPHPERACEPTHHPQWTRRAGCPHPAGRDIFKSAVAWFR